MKIFDFFGYGTFASCGGLHVLAAQQCLMPLFVRALVLDCIVYTAFLFRDMHAFWKENIKDMVKLLESNILICCQKITRQLISAK